MHSHRSLNESLGNIKVISDAGFASAMKLIFKARKRAFAANSISANSKVVEIKGIGDRFLVDLQAVYAKYDESPRMIFVEITKGNSASKFNLYNPNNVDEKPTATTILSALDILESAGGDVVNVDTSISKLSLGSKGEWKESKLKFNVKNFIQHYIGEGEYKALCVFDDPEVVVKLASRGNAKLFSDKYQVEKYSDSTSFMRGARAQANRNRIAKNSVSIDIRTATYDEFYRCSVNDKISVEINGSFYKVDSGVQYMKLSNNVRRDGKIHLFDLAPLDRNQDEVAVMLDTFTGRFSLVS